MESSDALILGGGFSGLACATALAQSGMRVTLLEKKPHLGGRAYSFRDPRTGETVDNGQHLFMGCYRHTRLFLRRIGAEHLLDFPGRVELHYADAEGRRDLLRLPWWAPAPVHLALGVAGLRGLSWTDKAALWGLDRAVRRMNGASSTRSLDRQTVREWLNALGQPARLQERLFDPIVIGALNELPERASALGFAQVLREVFYRQRENSMLGFARVGLSELYVEQARAFIEGRGGRVLPNRKAVRLVEEGGEVWEVVTESGERFGARAVVSSLPPWQLRRLERPPTLSGAWISWNASPIIGIHLWLREPLLEEPLIGLLGTEIHWVFNKTRLWAHAPKNTGSEADGQYLSLVISGAARHILKSPTELREMACRDLALCFPGFKKAMISTWSVTKEPFATPSPVPGSDAWRPDPAVPVGNFYYVGDWTQTGLPAAIESAVASGHACAQAILSRAGSADGSASGARAGRSSRGELHD